MMASCRSAAGAARHAAEHRQYLHRPVQGHDAGVHRRHFRFSAHDRGGARRSAMGGAEHQPSPAMSLPRCFISFAAMACRAMRAASKRGWRAAPAVRDSMQKAPRTQAADPIVPRRGGRDRRPAQMVRRIPCAARHRPEGRARRAHRHLRAVRRRQVDAAALHQPAGGLAARPHRRRRHRADRRSEADRRGAARRRHGVSAVQSVSASHRAGELHAGADLGAPHAEERRRGAGDEISRTRARFPSRPTNIRRDCPAASSSAWRLRARCA